MGTQNETGIQYFEIRDFRFQDGTALPSVRLAYQEFNPSATKTALVSTCFRGRLESTTNFAQGALKDYHVVVVALFGNGESSSPSNTATFASSLDYRDCVRAQKQLLSEGLNMSSLDVVVGFSMGGQCAYYWAAMYPEFVKNAVSICSSARTSLHNFQFLEGPRAALETSIDYEDGKYRAKGVKALRGLYAFGRAYSAWLTSAEWFEQRLFEKMGFKSLKDWTAGMEKAYDVWDPDDLLIMLGMWQRGDISVCSADQASLEETLGSLSANILLMPCRTDQYFKWEASERENKHLKNGRLEVIPSVWGHIAGGGANKEDLDWMDEKIAVFLGA